LFSGSTMTSLPFSSPNGITLAFVSNHVGPVPSGVATTESIPASFRISECWNAALMPPVIYLGGQLT
jgi:hypothetical protein